MPSDSLGDVVMWRWVISSSRVRKGWRRPRQWMPHEPTCFLVQLLDRALGVGYQPYRGMYPISMFRGRGALGIPVAVWPRPEYTMKRRNVQTESSPDGPNHLAAVETNIFHQLPNLVAHCCLVRYDDKSVRKPGWFTIKTMGAAWVVQVKDPDGGCQMQLTAQSLDDALCLADVMLGAETAPWEPDQFLRASEAKKKK